MTPICVDPYHIPLVWPHVRHFIENAFAKGRGDDSAGLVLGDLRDGKALLWIVWDSEQRTIVAAVTTKLLDVERGKVCLITACGGIDIFRWKDGLADIEAYAKAEGCRHVRIEGRKGFERLFPDYRQPWIVLEKRLD